MKKFLLIASVALFFASCATTNDLVIYREYSVRNTEPKQSPIIIAPLLAELQVLTDCSIRETINYDDFTVRSSNIREIENYKKMAIYTVAAKYNADTMVGALVNVDTTTKGKLTITVTGYPARYAKFRTMEEKDTWITNFDKVGKKSEKQSIKVDGLVNVSK